MTEQEWLTSSDPQVMLTYLLKQRALSDRKLRLFACACCRRVWDRLTDPASRKAVEVAELFADELISDRIRHQALTAAGAVHGLAATAAAWTLVGGISTGAMRVVDRVGEFAGASGGQTFDPKLWYAESQRQAELLRDIAGNPFGGRPADAGWRRSAVPVVGIAQTIYQEQRFGEMPILADALEEAGCGDADLIGHCRAGCRHVRGCWALDLVLVKA